jgi:hypothetical protein
MAYAMLNRPDGEERHKWHARVIASDANHASLPMEDA